MPNVHRKVKTISFEEAKIENAGNKNIFGYQIF